MTTPKDGWIGVDLDGTLAEYRGWIDTYHIGPPIPKMVARVRQWLGDGKDVRIFTARIAGVDELTIDTDPIAREFYRNIPHVTRLIEEWCLAHLGRKLPITCKKDYAMLELWDDRCIQVISNTGIRVDGKD